MERRINDLKIIKNKYGENMMHLCRELFPTLLEEPGFLSNLLLNNIAPGRNLYNDIIENGYENSFKNYIFSLVNPLSTQNNDKEIEIEETPEELMRKKGYTLQECFTEEEIQSYKKYYALGEGICTFHGGRLQRNRVFFAVKDNALELERNNFLIPRRQDEYGTSVISIQFSKDEYHTLMITNRYNHTVKNPDATFSNDLDNIVSGLTDSFEKYYGMKQTFKSFTFNLPKYVFASDGRYYKYNYKINGIYYCPNNIIIDNKDIYHYPDEQYIIMDYFVLDLRNKEILIYDKTINDGLLNCVGKIKNIEVITNGEIKKITITKEDGTSINITVDKNNCIKSFINNTVDKIDDNFMIYNETLEEISAKSLKVIGNNCLMNNIVATKISLPQVIKIGNKFLKQNETLEEIEMQSLEEVQDDFMYENIIMKKIILPKIRVVGKNFCFKNNTVDELIFKYLEKMGNDFFGSNEKIKVFIVPNLKKTCECLLICCQVEILDLSSVEYLEDGFMISNNVLKKVSMPRVKKIGNGCLTTNTTIEEIYLPLVEDIGNNFMEKNTCLKILYFPNIKSIGKKFLAPHSGKNILFEKPKKTR